MSYIVMKLGSKYVKELLVDYWGDVSEIKLTDNFIEAERVSLEDQKEERWIKFINKNEVVTIIKVELKEVVMNDTN